LENALADFDQAIKLDPKHYPAWLNRGNVHFQRGRLDQAVTDYSKAIDLNPELALARYHRGNAHYQLGKLDQAIADYSKVIEQAPNQPELVEVYLVRAQAHHQLRHFEDARTDYETFLKRVPAHAEAHRLLAWLLANFPDEKLRDPARAVRLAGKAVDLAPEQWINWKTLGVAHYRAGDWKAAVAAVDKSLTLSGDGEAVDWLFLAMAHRKLGNQDEARNSYEKAVTWLEKNKEALGKDKVYAEEVRRLRAEAEEVLEVKKQ
jgi:eukaryotic-like serine/threonine-protein kinase